MIILLAVLTLFNSYHAQTSYGDVTINFAKTENALDVQIETKRLRMRSIVYEDFNSYAALFGDQEVVEKFATGKPKTMAETAVYVNSWVSRWKNGNPFSAFAVIRKETNEFIGHMIMGYGDRPGQSEIAYIFLKNHRRQGYGNEGVSALVQGYALAIIQERYFLKGKSLSEVVATARTDNLGSIKILKNVGMELVSQEVKNGQRKWKISLLELLRNPKIKKNPNSDLYTHLTQNSPQR